MKKVLFIGVHPDDETLGCGGSILKHKEEGDEIYWLLISGIRNHPLGLWNEEAISKRSNTINLVSKEYGFKKVHQLDLPTMMLEQVDLGIFIKKLEKVFDEIQPEVVYMMNRCDVHSDHRVSFNAIYSCLKSFRRPYIHKILMSEILSETEFALALQDSAFVPNVYNDITPFMKKKLEIMSMYTTEVMEEPYPRSLGSIKALAQYRGTRAGVLYAEAFMLLYELNQ